MKKRVLLIDDEARVRASLKAVLEPTYETIQAADAQEGLELFRKEAPHLVLLDVILPGTDGLSVLQTMRAEVRTAPVIMLTGTKSVKTAVDAMKFGAADYLSKPFDVEELRIIVERALNDQELQQEVKQLRAQVVRRYAFHNLIGKSPSMQDIYTKIEQVADSRTTVLIAGESGTGKELVAKALHYNSGRRERPFIALNCAALPETLIESELFGHEKGSFTDATARRVGQFELANTGTLFLDEIGDLSAMTQAKLLRVLQEREFTRVGGVQSIKVDVRIVTATNQNLEDLVRKGQFREDLYYRINVIVLYLPPLRAPGEDIPLLAKHFLAKRMKKTIGPHKSSPKMPSIFCPDIPGRAMFERWRTSRTGVHLVQGIGHHHSQHLPNHTQERYPILFTPRRHSRRATIARKSRHGIRARNYLGCPKTNKLYPNPCRQPAGNQPPDAQVPYGHAGNRPTRSGSQHRTAGRSAGIAHPLPPLRLFCTVGHGTFLLMYVVFPSRKLHMGPNHAQATLR